MKHETFIKKCKVANLVYNTCWLVNQTRLFVWAIENIEACELLWEHTADRYPIEIVKRDCITALIKHAMKQALKDKRHTFRCGPLVVTYEPERYLEFEFDYDNTGCDYVYIHTKTGIKHGC